MKLTQTEIQLINVLDSVAGITARYCYADDRTITFLVKEADIGQAIGRKGAHIQKLREKLRKNVEILALAENPVAFLEKNLKIFKVEFDEVSLQKDNEKQNAVVKMDINNKEKMLRNMARLKRLKQILKNYYAIENLKLK